MSRTTKEINRITGTVIGVSVKIIIYALAALLLYEGSLQGYQFGYEIFHSEAVEEAPGTNKEITITKGTSLREAAAYLKDTGLIENEYAFIIQSKFYDYDIHAGNYKLNTSMTSKEILQILNENKTGEEKQS